MVRKLSGEFAQNKMNIKLGAGNICEKKGVGEIRATPQTRRFKQIEGLHYGREEKTFFIRVVKV